MEKNTGSPMNDAMNRIDEQYVEEFVQMDQQLQKRRNSRRTAWVRLMVAAVAVCLLAAAVAIPLALRRKDTDREPHFEAQTLVSGQARWIDNRARAGKVGAGEGEVVRVWDFAEKTLPEKYPILSYEGKQYRIANTGLQYEGTLPVDEALLGTQIGIGVVGDNEEQHAKSCPVYEIKGVANAYRVAVQLEDDDGEMVYFPYCTDAYTPPRTLGELFTRYDVSILSLPRCTITMADRNDSSTYALTKEDSDALLSILLEASDAIAIADEAAASAYEIHFTLCSEALGIRNLALLLGTQGELWTNVDGYGYAYRVGEETVQQILSYVKAHGSAADPNATDYEWTAGYVVALTDDTIVIDDSALMQNPADGMRFTVFVNTRQISRELSEVHLGDLVVVAHRGIAASNPNEIHTAVALDKGILLEDGVGILE